VKEMYIKTYFGMKCTKKFGSIGPSALAVSPLAFHRLKYA